MLPRLTIRARITGGSLVVAVLISIVAGVVIYNQVQRIVLDGQASVLQSVISPYVASLSVGPAEEVDQPGQGQLVAVRDPSGRVQVDTLPDGLSGSVDRLAARSGETFTEHTADGSYLVKVVDVAAASGDWIIIAADADDVESPLLSQIAVLLIIAIAAINVAFAAASWFIGSAALAPVGRLRRSAAVLVQEPGDDLLPVGPAQDEIAELATTLNQLVTQLRASAERERQVVADASHELRTPLAIMQTQLELAQRDTMTMPQLKRDVAAAQRTLTRLIGIATAMLELSRIDAQQRPGSASGAALVAEIADAADRGRTLASGRDVRIDYSSAVPDDLEVAVAAGDFGQVCDNLIGNALAALGQTGAIDLDVRLEGSRAVLRVSDDAGGMDPAFVPFAFDRFSRADGARTGGGAGLGLPIVAAIANRAGGAARLENRPGQGLTVVVEFQASSEEGQPATARLAPR
jgi:two-component system OmpR family sensor kinase